MSRQPEEKNQGVSEFSTFRFPENGKASGRPSVQKASWASLAAKRDRPELRSPASKSYVKTSFSESVVKSAEVKPVETVGPEDDLPVKKAKSSAKVEVQAKKKAGTATPVEQEEVVDSAAIQKILDDMYQKGLELGRQEGRSEQLGAVREEARQAGFSEGRQQGVSQGVQQGLEQAGQELQSRYAVLDQLAGELGEQKKVLSDQQIGLISRLLEKLLLEILRVELKHSPEQIEAVVRESVAMLDAGEQEVLRVYLHPDDVNWISELADLEQLTVRFIEDGQVLPGGCRIEGVQGDVDATLKTRLSAGIEHIRTLLLGDDHAPQQKVAEVIDEFSVSLRASRAVDAETVVSSEKRPVPVAETQVPVSVTPSFSFDPEAVSGLGAWDSLGQ